MMNQHRVFVRLSASAEKAGLRLVAKHDARWLYWAESLPFAPSDLFDGMFLLGDTIYFPSPKWCRDNPELAWKSLAAKMVVSEDVQAWTPYLFYPLYLFPQSLSLLAVLALWKSPWWALFLLALLPWPAPFRKRVEMRACAMLIAADYWLGKETVFPSLAMVQRFTGPSHYFMWPFKRQVRKELTDWSLLIARRKSFGKLPYAAEVKFAIRIESVLR